MSARLSHRIKAAALLALSLLGSVLMHACVFGPVPFDLFWGFAALAVVPAGYVSTLSRTALAKLPLVAASLWCAYLAVGSGATYL